MGETARSSYERGWEHKDDIRQLKPSSHLLKHLVDKHEGSDFSQIDLRMEILSFSICQKSNFVSFGEFELASFTLY